MKAIQNAGERNCFSDCRYLVDVTFSHLVNFTTKDKEAPSDSHQYEVNG
jgi:hypothetical protein